MACGSVSSLDITRVSQASGGGGNPDPREVDPGIEPGHVQELPALILAQEGLSAAGLALVQTDLVLAESSGLSSAFSIWASLFSRP